jgi:hypothetical protein
MAGEPLPDSVEDIAVDRVSGSSRTTASPEVTPRFMARTPKNLTVYCMDIPPFPLSPASIVHGRSPGLNGSPDYAIIWLNYNKSARRSVRYE